MSKLNIRIYYIKCLCDVHTPVSQTLLVLKCGGNECSFCKFQYNVRLILCKKTMLSVRLYQPFSEMEMM